MSSASDTLLEALRRAFPVHEVAPLHALLLSYGEQSYHNEPQRVRLAIVQLCAGDPARLPIYLAMAKQDYRDVLAAVSLPLPTEAQTAADLAAVSALLERWGDD